VIQSIGGERFKFFASGSTAFSGRGLDANKRTGQLGLRPLVGSKHDDRTSAWRSQGELSNTMTLCKGDLDELQSARKS
jgi:hypothetical protein